MICSQCGHPIDQHYPNFKDGKPLTFYCGHGAKKDRSDGLVFGAEMCPCLRDENQIQWQQDGEKFYAVAERL